MNRASTTSRRPSGGASLPFDKARFDFDESVPTLLEHGPNAKAQGGGALVESFVYGGAVRRQAEGETAKVMAVAAAMIGR